MLGFRAALEAVSGRTSLEITGAGIGVDEERLATLAWLRTFGRISRSSTAMHFSAPRGERWPMRSWSVYSASTSCGIARSASTGYWTTPGLDRSRREAFLSLLTDPQAVVLTQAFADRQGLELESGVELLVGDRRVSLIVRGLLGDEGPAQVLDGKLRADGHRRGAAGARAARAGRSG